MERYKSRQGFTLVEIILILVLIGFLSAFAIVRFTTVQNEAKAKNAKAAVASAQSAISMAYAQHIVNPVSTHHVSGPSAACMGVALNTNPGTIYTVTCDGDDWDITESNIMANYDGEIETGKWIKP